MLYEEAARILKTVDEKKGTVKSLCISSDYKNTKELFAVVCESLKYSPVIDEIVKTAKFVQDDKVLKANPYLTTVLLHDFLFTKHGLRHCNKRLKEAIIKHKSMLHSALVRLKVKNKVSTNEGLLKDQDSVTIPRYVRVNLLKSSVSAVEKWFVEHGFELLPRPQTHAQFLTTVESLGKKQFFQDVYMEELFVFLHTDFHANELYKDGNIILQDKASCVPGYVLRPPPGAAVLDACAAPGNKTSHACAYMKNKGKMHAFDTAPKRVQIMRTLLNKAGVQCATLHNTDFLSTLPQDYRKVEYAIVDPSCSGSGIVSRLGNLTDNAESSSTERLSGLATFQVSALSHALSFPAMKRVVYSTCSVHQQENEEVVKTVLKTFGDRFHLVPVLPAWPSRGLTSVYPEADKCLRVSPKADRTNGFFVACFERKGWTESAADLAIESEECETGMDMDVGSEDVENQGEQKESDVKGDGSSKGVQKTKKVVSTDQISGGDVINQGNGAVMNYKTEQKNLNDAKFGKKRKHNEQTQEQFSEPMGKAQKKKKRKVSKKTGTPKPVTHPTTTKKNKKKKRGSRVPVTAQ